MCQEKKSMMLLISSVRFNVVLYGFESLHANFPFVPQQNKNRTETYNKGVIAEQKLVFGVFYIKATILFQHSGEMSKQASVSSDY